PYLAATRALAIGHRNVALRSSASGGARITEFPEAPWYFTRINQKQTETEAEELLLRIFPLGNLDSAFCVLNSSFIMAHPIHLELPARDPRAELLARVQNAPVEHAEALLSAYN